MTRAFRGPCSVSHHRPLRRNECLRSVGGRMASHSTRFPPTFEPRVRQKPYPQNCPASAPKCRVLRRHLGQKWSHRLPLRMQGTAGTSAVGHGLTQWLQGRDIAALTASIIIGSPNISRARDHHLDLRLWFEGSWACLAQLHGKWRRMGGVPGPTHVSRVQPRETPPPLQPFFRSFCLRCSAS